MPWNEQTFAFQGGLDIVTPAIRTPPGRAIGGRNYEPVERGYGRVQGFERLDGRPKPSDARYWVLSFDAGRTAALARQTITGATSGATGVLLYTMEAETGSFAGNDAAGTMVLTQVNGRFSDNEALQVSGSTVAAANGIDIVNGSSDDDLDETWRRAAIEYARDKIARVPGSGPVRGVWVYKGSKYAVRDNDDASAGVLHKAGASGWQAQTLGRTMAFSSGGNTAIAEGDKITGATSGATATVKRVILRSGAWASGTAVGRFVLAGQSGTFQSESLNVGASRDLATIGGDSSAISLPAGGRYEFRNHNFFGASNRMRMYGVNGVGPAFEWDGETMVPIVTGMSSDKPNHIEVMRNHLFLSFAGGSIQNSSTGDPYKWSAITGASEIGLGQEITGMMLAVERSMMIQGRNKIAILYGDDSNNWRLDTLADDAGAIEWSAQRIGRPYYIDDRGLRNLKTTEAFGDFRIGTVTETMHPFFSRKRKEQATVKASIRSREKDQYRVFYSDGTGFTTYFGRKYPETLPFNLGVTVECACSSEELDGSEIMLFGTDDGWVHQLDAGTSFDGEEIEAFLRMPFSHVGGPNRVKKWRKAKLEMDAAPNTTLALVAEFGYGALHQPQSVEQDFTVAGRGGFWDEDDWSSFFWDAPDEGIAETRLKGRGENLSLTVIHRSIYEEPHVLQSATLFYTPLRLDKRG